MHFFSTASPTTEIYTLSLHDLFRSGPFTAWTGTVSSVSKTYLYTTMRRGGRIDRKSTRLNSSHEWISYAVFCLKKKKNRRSNYIHILDMDNTLDRCSDTQGTRRSVT